MYIEDNRDFMHTVNGLRLEIRDSGYARTNGDWKGVHVSSPFSRLYYITQGCGTICVGDTPITIESGNVYLIPCGYTCRYESPARMDQLYFHIHLFNGNGFDILGSCKRCLTMPLSLDAMRSLADLYRSHDLQSLLLLTKQVFGHVVDMLSTLGSIESISYTPCVQQAMEYIQQHMSMRLEVNAIAKQLFVSESTLAKKFKRETGMSISRYIDTHILFQAERLLTKTNYSVQEIADQLGFCDQFYFSRKFAEKFSESPMAYRKRNRNVCR